MKKSCGIFLLIMLILVTTSCSFTTANLSNLTMASEVDESNQPTIKTTVFQTNSPIFYATGKLNNAPGETLVKADWYFIGSDPETFIDSASLSFDEITSDFAFSLSAPDSGWPVGAYEVRFFIDDVSSSTLSFTVE